VSFWIIEGHLLEGEGEVLRVSRVGRAHSQEFHKKSAPDEVREGEKGKKPSSAAISS